MYIWLKKVPRSSRFSYSCSRCSDMWILAAGALHFSWSTLRCVTADNAYQSKEPWGQKNCSAAQRHHGAEADTWGIKITSTALKVPESTQASIILKCNKSGTSSLFPELTAHQTEQQKGLGTRPDQELSGHWDGWLHSCIQHVINHSTVAFCTMSL